MAGRYISRKGLPDIGLQYDRNGENNFENRSNRNPFPSFRGEKKI